jgi:pimeloyl-ACP methyl ester carboxylesterase
MANPLQSLRTHDFFQQLGTAALAVCLAACQPNAPSGAASAQRVPVPAGAVDPEATNYAYPFPVRFFELESQRQRLRMAYVDSPATNANANGRAVVLLHGKNFTAAHWAATIRALNDAGYRVIAPDQIGFGKSSKPERYQYSFAGLATNTLELLRSLGINRSAIVGHSMGGMLAARYALTFPEAVERLVLVNPLGLEDYGAVVPYHSVDFWYQRELENTPDKIREYQKTSYFAGVWKPEYEPLIELAVGFTKHPDYPRVAWASALTYDMILTQPVVDALPNLKVPTLLVVGLRDRTAVGKDLVPPEQRDELGRYDELGPRAAKAIPDAKWIGLSGVGHLPQVEAFDAYRDALLAFLHEARP